MIDLGFEKKESVDDILKNIPVKLKARLTQKEIFPKKDTAESIRRLNKREHPFFPDMNAYAKLLEA